MQFLIKIFLSFLRSSLSTSVFILLVIAILSIFNKKINVRVKNALWILILIKLLIPVAVHVDMNLFGMLNQKDSTSVQTEQAVTVTNYQAENGQLPFDTVNNDNKKENYDNYKKYNYFSTIFQMAAIIWLDGVFLLSLFLLITQYNFKKNMKIKTNIEDSRTLALIEKIKNKLSIKSEISVAVNNQIKSPCISGILKPTVYIPEYILKMSDPNQLSYIFLHEFVHYKRKDILYNFFSIIALLIHWYNPLVWVAVKKMKLYRECTCDACVLELLNEEENIEYGMTLLNYSKLYLNRDKYSQYPIYFETNNQIKERIIMIKGFHKGSYKMTGKVILSCVIAAGIIFTNNLEVKALNTDNILRSTSTLTAPGQGSGWYHENNKWYYKKIIDGVADKDFCRQDGPNETEYWLFDSENWYYFDKQGVMVHNTTLEIDGKNYIFEKNGVCTNKIQTGWVIDDGDSRWYYYDENGVMLKNTTVDGNKLDEDGRLVVKAKEKSTSTDKSQYGWYQQNGKWYSKVEGKIQTETWAYVNGNWYYFDKQGAMVSNTTLKIEGKDYVFAKNGVCTNFDEKKGWNYDYGKWHYYDENGVMLKNTTVDGYKLDADGTRVESENNESPDAYYIPGAGGSLVDLQLKNDYARDLDLTDGWYSQNHTWYLKKDNNNVKGWVKHNHAWVYLDEQGVLAEDTTLKIDGKDYVFDINGVCTNKLD